MRSRHIEGATRLAQAALLRRIKYMILHVNSVCNAKCRMCFSWDAMMERWDAKGHTVENLAKLAASMKPLPQLTVSGGEPTLRKDLPQILQVFYQNAGTRFFTCPTNSLKPDRVERTIDYFVEHCPRGFLNFCLPFHGDEEHYDEIMGVPGNFEKFNETYQLIQEKRKKHPNISCVLNFVMSKFNYGQYKSIIDMGVRKYSESPLGIAYCRGLTHERDATDVPVDIYLDAKRYLEARLSNHSRYNPYTIMFDTVGGQVATIIADVVTGERRDLKCGAGRNFIVVYDNGSVHPCELLEVVGIPGQKPGDGAPPQHAELGNLNDFGYDMKALLASPYARKLIDWIDTHECACTWECAVYSQIVHSPSGIAKLGAQVARYLAKGGPARAPVETAEPPAS